MSQRRPWTQDQDQIILRLVQEHGTKKWTTIAQEMQKCYQKKPRTSKQIRQRWHNHLDPNVNKKQWTSEEERILFESHRQFGSRWKEIASKLQGRTDNHVKNYFYSTMRRALRRVNKFLGYKNSTTQMRTIRPSILSYLLDLADVSSQIRSLVSRIIELSKFKPTKTSKQYSFLEVDRENYQAAIKKLMKINEAYSKKGSRKLYQFQEFKEHQKGIVSKKMNVKIQQTTPMLPNENQIKPDIKQEVREEQQSASWQDQDGQSNHYHTMPQLEKPQYQCDLLTKKQQNSEPTQLGHQIQLYGHQILWIHRQVEAVNLFEF